MTCRGILLLLSLIVCCSSCVLYPRYERPNVEVPESWRFTADEESSFANYRWWQQLGDPVLDGLIIESLENNYNLKVAIERVFQYAGQLMIARSGLYPQIGGKGIGTKEKISGDLFPLPGAKLISDDFLAVFTASYELDIWGKIRSGSDAALAQLLAQEEVRRTVVLTLVGNVASAYILLRQFDKQLQISKDTYESRKEAYHIADLRYLGGLTSELEAKQAEAEMEQAAAAVVQFELAVAIQEDLLSTLVGHPPTSMPRGTLLDSMALAPQVPAGLPSALLEQRPDVLAAEHNLIAANANIGVARAAFFPDISLTGFYGNESTHLKNLFTSNATTWAYGVNVLQAFFTGGRLTGQLKVAESIKWQAYYQYCQTLLQAFQEVDDALVSYQRNKELFVIQNRRANALEAALKLANLQYDNGQVDYLNVLDAQRTLFNAQLDMVSAQGDSFLSLVDLYTSLGGGWVVDADNIATECDGVWPKAWPVVNE